MFRCRVAKRREPRGLHTATTSRLSGYRFVGASMRIVVDSRPVLPLSVEDVCVCEVEAVIPRLPSTSIREQDLASRRGIHDSRDAKDG